MRIRRLGLFGIFALPPVALILLVVGSSVGAAGPFWGIGSGVGYFSQARGKSNGWCSDLSGNAVARSGCTPGKTWSYTLPIISSGEAVPFANVGTCSGSDLSCVNNLVSLLKSANTSGEGRKYASSGFIVNRLLGRNSPGNGKTVSVADWADVTARLQAAQVNGLIGWNDSTSSSQYESYSMWMGGNGGAAVGDDSWASATHTTNAIVIYSTSSHASALFTMYRTCANVRGSSVGIPLANYTLVPTIAANASLGESGSIVQQTSTVTDTDAAPSSGSQWQLSQFVVAPGGNYPGAGNSPSAPAQYYGNGLTKLDGGTGVSFPVGPKVISQAMETLPDEPVGYKVCFALSVQARSSGDTNWAHSAPVCVVISVKPKAHVLGGDLSAGKSFLGTSVAVPFANIDTSVSTKSISGGVYTFGSWIEYGIFATGIITNAGSASAYAGSGGNAGLQNATTCSETLLSFSNASTNAGCDAVSIGNYATSRSIPDVASTFPVVASTPQFGASNLSSTTTQGIYTSSSDLTLTGGSIGAASGQAGAGRWVVINAPDANVTITGNITYTNGVLTSINDIPQLIIIAKNIYIADNVTQIDAWLIAKPSATLSDGVLNTCAYVGGARLADTAPLSSTICNKQLLVNGPVMANRLLLRRTTDPGTGSNSGNAAETFNLRPDAYLWADTHVQSSGRIQTVYTTELPPRL